MSSTCFEPKGHLQEDDCIYRYGKVCFTCIIISNFVGRRVECAEASILVLMIMKRMPLHIPHVYLDFNHIRKKKKNKDDTKVDAITYSVFI